jgi:hypothetical protein
MSDVFISYAKTDRHQAEALADDLKLHGYSVWWDTALYGGEDFHDVIFRALDDAKAVIVIWSESSAKSQWVRGEAQHAQSQQKLIPTKFAKLRDADIPLNFRTLHTEPLEDRDRILRAVERLTGKRSRAPSAGTAGAPNVSTSRAARAENQMRQLAAGTSAWPDWRSPRRWVIFWVALISIAGFVGIWVYLDGYWAGFREVYSGRGRDRFSWTPIVGTVVVFFAFVVVERLTRRR